MYYFLPNLKLFTVYTFQAQPGLRTFPTSAKLHEDQKEDCYPVVMDLLRSRRFMESILILVASPLFCEPPLYIAIRDLFFMLMSTQKGTFYFIRQLINLPLENQSTPVDIRTFFMNVNGCQKFIIVLEIRIFHMPFFSLPSIILNNSNFSFPLLFVARK